MSGCERLKSRKLIAAVFSQGKAISQPLFRAVFLAAAGDGSPSPHAMFDTSRNTAAGTSTNDRPVLQAGFSASSRNFKRAVDRNRIKRLMREAYRREKHILEQHLREKNLSLSLFLIYTGKQLPDYPTVLQQIRELIRLLVKKIDRSAGNPNTDLPGKNTSGQGSQQNEQPLREGRPDNLKDKPGAP